MVYVIHTSLKLFHVILYICFKKITCLLEVVNKILYLSTETKIIPGVLGELNKLLDKMHGNLFNKVSPKALLVRYIILFCQIPIEICL